MLKNMVYKYRNMSPTVKAGIWYTICNFMQKGISLITVPIFTRMLTTEEYGTYTVFTSWESIISIFATLNLTYYVFDKGMVKYEDDRDNFVGSLQTLSSLVCIIVFAVYFLFSSCLGKLTKLNNVIMMMMALYLFFYPATKFWSARQRFEYRYKPLVMVTLSTILLDVLLGLLLVSTMSDGGFARVLSIVLAGAGVGIVFYISNIRKAFGTNLTKYWRYALAFNIPLIPHFLTNIILHNADRIMINNMCGASSAAIYAVAYSGGMIMVLVNNSVQQSILPWIYTRMKKEQYERTPTVFSMTLLLIAGLNIILILFAPEIISILAPVKYHEAIWVIPPVAASAYFMYLYNLFANVEMYFEESKLITASSVGLALLNIVLNYIFIKLYGYIAAGHTTLFCYVIFCVVHYLMMKHILKKHNKIELLNKMFNMKHIFFISAFISVFAVLVTLVYGNYILRYLITALVILVGLMFRVQILDLLKSLKSNKSQ